MAFQCRALSQKVPGRAGTIIARVGNGGVVELNAPAAWSMKRGDTAYITGAILETSLAGRKTASTTHIFQCGLGTKMRLLQWDVDLELEPIRVAEANFDLALDLQNTTYGALESVAIVGFITEVCPACSALQSELRSFFNTLAHTRACIADYRTVFNCCARTRHRANG